jgi:diguanylate cyclase (GGDEF)-like protein/PAS domain S-box-containing protein
MNSLSGLPTSSLPIPILVCDWNGVIVSANERAQMLFDSPLVHRQMDAILDFGQADIGKCASFADAARFVLSRSVDLNSLNIPFKKPPTSHICLYFSRLEQDAQELIALCIQDISDYKNHIKTFKYQQNLLDNIVSTSNDALVVFDEAGYIELFNPTAEKLFGISAAEATMGDVQSLFGAQSHATVADALSKLKNSGPDHPCWVFENLITQNADGIAFPSSVSFSRSRRDTDALFFMIVSDKSLFHAFINSVDDAYLKTDEKGYIIDLNKRAEAIFGAERPTLLGQHIGCLGIKKLPSTHAIQDIRLLTSINSEEDYVVTNSRGEELNLNLTAWPQVLNNTQLNNIIIKDISQKKIAEKQLIVSAFTDSLTKLANRERFHHELKDQVETSRSAGSSFALLVIDLDKFKEVNDGYGHDYGDRLLKAAAKRLSSCVRENDLVARMGGDEFTIIMRMVHSDKDAVKVAERILKSFRKDFAIKEKRLSVSSSIGIAIFPEDASAAEKLLKSADMAMYAAKKSGKDNYSRFNQDMHKTHDRRKLLERALTKAQENNELSLHFQPKISFSKKQVVGFEALLRWHNPELGFVSPMEFIPIAEETGQIVEMTRWILAKAVSTVRDLPNSETTSGSKLTIAVNISPDHFKHDLSGDLHQILQQEQFDPALLEIEITESTLLERSSDVVDTLNAISALGIHISIDDFGTGYSSLQYLKHFRLNTLKIDRSFVRDIHTDQHNIFIVESIISIAKRMNLNLVAEGVESINEINHLATLGCDIFQGFYYSKPIPATDIPIFLRNFRANSQQP